MNAIEIYKGNDNETHVVVKFEEETVWLNQKQIADVFGTQRPAITKHLNNIFRSGELKENVVRSILEHTTQHGAIEGKTQLVKSKYYNLDAIISVGYRINSNKATQFRIWATQRLKDYLVKGYSINEQKLKTSQQQLNTLKQSIQLLDNVVKNKQLSSGEAIGLLKVVTEYAHALELLDQYDHQRLVIPETKKEKFQKITYKEAIKQIQLWRNKQKAGKLFGNEKDQSFNSSLETIYQTFNGKDLYPGINEKAANLLYFIVKNHSFTDGNKRIAAGLFIYFLDKNKKLYNSDGSKIIADNALVAITIMIAESKTEEKEVMIKLIVNLMSAN
ncbi:MAG: RhuM family protein [Ferruginibacter sp.]